MKLKNGSRLDSAEDAREADHKTLYRRACRHLVPGGRDFLDGCPSAGAMAWRALGVVPAAYMDTLVAAVSGAGAVCCAADHPRAGQTCRGLSCCHRPCRIEPDCAGGRRDPQTGPGRAAVHPEPRQTAVDSGICVGLRKIPPGHGPAGDDGGVADGAALEPDRQTFDSPLAIATQSFVGPAADTMTQPPLRIGTTGGASDRRRP